MALVFVLALLLDSACATACIPLELQPPAEHCASGGPGGESPERGCNLHGHLKPVVQDRGLAAAAPMDDWPPSLEIPAVEIDLGSFRVSADFDVVSRVPPLFQRTSVLRI